METSLPNDFGQGETVAPYTTGAPQDDDYIYPFTAVDGISRSELAEMREWFILAKATKESASKMEYLAVDLHLGQDFNFEDFLNIVKENRDQRHWFGHEVEIPLIIAYLLIIIFGVFANGLICYVICGKKKLRTVRNMFIVNLSISDLIMCLICMPSTLVKLLLKNWPLGDAMCRLIPWLQAVNVFASTMTIIVIAVDRYHVIVYPGTMKDSTKKWGALTVILLIWFCSVLVGLPLLVYSHLEVKEYIRYVTFTMCLEVWPSNTARFVYAAVIMVLQFIAPVIILITIHWRICNFLKTRIMQNPTTPMEMNRAMKEAKRHRKNSSLLMAIAVLYALCWFPLTLLNLLADFDYFIFMHKNFLLAFAVSHMVAMISACVNPVVYGWFNTNFRREFSRIVCFCCRQEQYDTDKQVGAQQAEPQQIVYKRQVSYKSVQTQVQPVLMRQDSPHRDSVGLLSTSSRSNSADVEQ